MAQESVRRGDAKTHRAADLPAIITNGLRIVGKVECAGAVHIEGEVRGDVDCLELTIGPQGRVNGEVTAATVHVYGEVGGTIRAQTVHIAKGAVVTAEVIHETLVVEPGARLDGYYRPVDKLSPTAGVDVRRQIGRLAAREARLPHRPLPPQRKRPRRRVTLLPPRDETTKSLH